MASTGRPSCIYVLAGANGAGKSSIGGAALLQHGVEYFNPDEAARRILAANPTIIQEDANSAAWHEGKRLLERAITERLNFAFETTLGGNTIPALLERALESGIEVRVWYFASIHLSSTLHACAPELRGWARHSEVKIRERYHRSRLNLVRLIRKLTNFAFTTTATKQTLTSAPFRNQ